MAIKGQLARIERQLAKSGHQVSSFLIPYCRDKKTLEDVKHNLLIKYNLASLKDRTTVFVINYATASSVACLS